MAGHSYLQLPCSKAQSRSFPIDMIRIVRCKLLFLFLLLSFNPSGYCEAYDKLGQLSPIVKQQQQQQQQKLEISTHQFIGKDIQNDDNSSNNDKWISTTEKPLDHNDQKRKSTTIVEGIRVVSSLRGGGTLNPLLGIDRIAKSWVMFLAWVVSFQAIGTAVHSHRDQLFELASRFVSRETIAAAKVIRSILTSVDDHGIIDIFSKYPPQQILSAIFALSRIQTACHYYHYKQQRRRIFLGNNNNNNDIDNNNNIPDETLLNDLCCYAPFAAAAYGWTMDLATAGRLHRGDLQAIVKMTGIELDDIVFVNWESKANRPSFYIVRDRKRKRIVLSIRGTWSAQDVLTDLCCTPEEYYAGGQPHKAHYGMLAAAREVALLAKDVIAEELNANKDYSLLLVGHSLGGSVAAILGNIWEENFPGITVYIYGPACVSPQYDRGVCRIISVVLEGDPFSCLSLGHVADVSCALAYLCDNSDLRSAILMRTDGPSENLDERDLEWCSETMKEIQEQMTGEKLFPPGKLYFMSGKSKLQDFSSIMEVPTDFFKELKVGPRMFDLSRHIPRLYESELLNCKRDLYGD